MKKLTEFPVLHAGWELDSRGWVVEDGDGKRSIMLTNNLKEYMADPQELIDKINEYQSAISKTVEALTILEKGK